MGRLAIIATKHVKDVSNFPFALSICSFYGQHRVIYYRNSSHVRLRFLSPLAKSSLTVKQCTATGKHKTEVYHTLLLVSNLSMWFTFFMLMAFRRLLIETVDASPLNKPQTRFFWWFLCQKMKKNCGNTFTSIFHWILLLKFI